MGITRARNGTSSASISGRLSGDHHRDLEVTGGRDEHRVGVQHRVDQPLEPGLVAQHGDQRRRIDDHRDGTPFSS
jgi:hypothetical protein